MLTYLRSLFNRHFSDPQVIILILLLVAATGVILLFGKLLAPAIASLVLAYLLDGLVSALKRKGVPRWLAVVFVFVIFLACLFFTIFALVPLLYREVTRLIQELPRMWAMLEAYLLNLPEEFPELFNEQQVEALIRNLQPEVERLGEVVLSASLNLLPTVLAVVMYLVLMPLMVFFFLKDKAKILAWFKGYLPRDHSLADRVWRETNRQVANYLRGKFWEILIVGGVTYATFYMLELNYAVLLAVLVGLSVLIPYIGAAVVTFPILGIAYFQWGWSAELVYVMIAYAIIQTLDANVLFPLIFSKVVDLHPVAIIVALLFFGGIWGFWGIFFAVPLATLVKAILSSWPRAAAPPEGENTAVRADRDEQAHGTTPTRVEG